MILLFVSSHLLHFTAYHLPSVHASQTNVELQREVLPRFMPSPCFGMQKRFSHPNVHVGGAKALLDHLPRKHTKLATSAPHTSMKVIWCEFPSCQTIATTSPFAPPTMHPFMSNCTFNPFNKSLLTETKLVCNLST